MAARIQPIEPGRGPSADISAPHYGGRSAVLSTGIGVDSLGQSLGHAASILQTQQDVQKQRDDMLALNDAHVSQSAFARDQDQIMRQMQQDWSGDPSDFHEKYMGQYDAQAKALVNGTQNEKAKLFLGAQTASMGVLAQHSALNWQATAQVHYYDDQHKEILKNYIPMAARDEALYQPIVEQVNEFVDRLRLPQAIKDGMRALTEKSIADSTLTGFTERNPGVAADLLRASLGIKQEAPKAPNAQAVSGFEANVTRILGVEGGYAANDAGAGPTKFGINGKANPKVDLSTLTREGARDIYKAEYWDAIKADELTPAAAAIAFDAAVNQGVTYAKKLIEQSGGYALKMIALRRERYAETAKIPGKEAYLPAWNARLDALVKYAMPTTTPTDAVLASVDAMMWSDAPQAGSFVSPTAASLQTTGFDWIDKQDPHKRIAALHHAEALLNEGKADAQHELRVAYTNAAAQAEHGIAPTFPDPSVVEKALGVKRAPEVLVHFGELRDYAAVVSQTQTMTPQQMTQTYERMVPTDINDPLWAEKAKHAEAFKASAGSVFKARQDDGMGAARDQGLAKIDNIDWMNPEKAVTEFVSRTEHAVRNHDLYGAKGYSALTKNEAAIFEPTWHKLTEPQQMGIFAMLKAGIKDERVYRDTVAGFVKDAPAVMRAAQIMDRPQSDPDMPSGATVAGGLLKGDRMLAPDKYAKAEDGQGKVYSLPKVGGADGMDAAIANKIGAAFTGQPEDYHETVQEIHRYYAYLSSLESAYSEALPDGTRLQKAIKVIARTAEWSRGTFTSMPVVMPFGMTPAQFQPALVNAYEAAMRKGGIAGTSLDVPQALKPFRVSEHVYRFTNGTSVLRGLDGREIEANVEAQEYGPPINASAGGRAVSGPIR
jgi:hypothetical protein